MVYTKKTRCPDNNIVHSEVVGLKVVWNALFPNEGIPVDCYVGVLHVLYVLPGSYIEGSCLR